MSRALPVITAIATLAATGLMLVPRSQAHHGDTVGPHVVLVIGCTVRRDELSPYGGKPVVTPHLQSIADEGARFTHAVSAAPWTKASITALLTGHHALGLGMIEPSLAGNRKVLPDDLLTLAERFDAAGYTTLGLTANPNINALFGFDQGHDKYWEATPPWRQTGEIDWTLSNGQRVAEHALEMVDSAPAGQPIFLRAIFIDPHRPRPVPTPTETKTLGLANQKLEISSYQAGVHRFDQAVRTLDEGLQARGLTPENTLFVVVNDHGEGLKRPKAHGRGHGGQPLLSTVGMPWLVRGPGIPAGHRVTTLASGVDLTPTLAELAGVEQGEVTGRSWASAVRGGEPREPRAYAYSDTWLGKNNRAAVYTQTASCLDDFGSHPKAHKPNARSFPACFDLTADPTQAQQLEAPIQPLLDELHAWRRRTGSHRKAQPEEADLDPGLIQQLEALGYAQ